MKKDIGIDLGTANTLVYIKSKGIVINEPSVVAVDRETSAVLSVGDMAKEMIGKTPENIAAVSPLKNGVVADFDAAQAMLKFFMKKAFAKNGLIKPRLVVSVPSEVTSVERRAVEEAAIEAGAREVHLIEGTMAAAIGANLPIDEPVASMIVDIGGGTSEVAVISLGGIVTGKTLRIAGDAFDLAIARHVKKAYNLIIGQPTAEKIKISIGSAFNVNDGETLEVKGRDSITGLPQNVTLTAKEVREAMADSIMAIVDAIKLTLEHTPPELASDIIDRGITITGGGALLRGMNLIIEQETGMRVTIAETPLDCVANGTGKVLDELDMLKKDLPAFKRGW